jgi:hypothetical protein
MFVYQATIAPKFQPVDYPTLGDAALAVQQSGSGSVVKFIRNRNLPNCLPEYVLKSLAMWTFENGKWYSIYIFGSGGRVEQDPTE